jgi:hypothetical protein
MKNLIILFVLVNILCSCDINEREYRIAFETIIPDSLKSKQLIFIKETVSASNFHMSGGDYEDPEDVIEQAEITFNRIYGVPVKGLATWGNEHPYEFIPFNKLNKTQLKIYNELDK